MYNCERCNKYVFTQNLQYLLSLIFTHIVFDNFMTLNDFTNAFVEILRIVD